MKIVFLALIPFFILFISSAHAENLCVGMAKNKYCLGKPLPKKAGSYEVTTLDGGIDIQTRKNRSSRFNFGNEVDGLSGLSLATTIVTQYGKVASVNQYYRIDPKDHQSKARVYFLLERRLTRQYGKPSTRTILEELKYTEWRSHLIDINISDAEEENVSVSFSISSRL
jgi:hypothetical protein